MSILVYSRTAGYRHDSIPQAIDTIRSMGYNATFTEDPSYFDNTTSLERYQALVFLSTTDEILEAEQKANLESYLVKGGGLVGIHSATSALFNTPFFGTAFGAFFDRHPELQNATFEVVDSTHPSTASLPSRWNFIEEVYNFKSDPRDTNVTLLLTVDRDSYEDVGKVGSEALQGSPHPIAWYRDQAVNLGNGTGTNGMNATNGTEVEEGSFVANGRMWYTSLGHTIDIWRDATFQAHVQGGIDWVLAQNTTAEATAATGIPVAGIAPSPSAGHLSGSSSARARACLNMPKRVMLSLFACTLLAGTV